MNKKLQKISAICLLGTMLLYSLPVVAFTKDETVYSNAKANGEKYKSIVTVHLENTEEEKVLKDLTDLLNIENTNGDETFEQNGDTIIWNSNQNDIYYKGESNKELPVEVSVTYELDGEEIEPEKIAGKSGKVTVTIEFTNRVENEKWINGRYEKIYTPFVVAAGTYINNENNKNIEIQNGKLINDGSKTFAIGLAFPGMQESLDLSEELYKIPESIVITMETENFEMNNIINYVTPIKFDDSKLDVVKKLNDIYSQVDKLQSASNQIEQGAKTLAEGTTTYYQKSQEFNQAIGQFSSGMSNANSSYSELNTGIKTIESGSKQLQSGSKELSDGTAALNVGVDTMKSQVTASAGKVPELVDGAGQVYNGLEQLYAGINQAANTENTEVTEQLTGLVTVEKTQAGTLMAYNQSLAIAKAGLQAIDTTDLNVETITAIQTAIGTLDAQMTANTQIAGTLNTNADNYIALVKNIVDTTKTQLQGLAKNVGAIKDGAQLVSEGTKTVQTNMSALTNGLDTLSSSTKQISDGASSLYNGTASLSSGASQLKSGSAKMKEGLQTLDVSAKAILDADTQLTEGAKTIEEGAKKLASGVEEFNQTGINKISNFINNDVRKITDRIELLKDLSEKYNTFTKATQDIESNVKFITIIDAIKQTDENDGQEKIDEKPSK